MPRPGHVGRRPKVAHGDSQAGTQMLVARSIHARIGADLLDGTHRDARSPTSDDMISRTTCHLHLLLIKSECGQSTSLHARVDGCLMVAMRFHWRQAQAFDISPCCVKLHSLHATWPRVELRVLNFEYALAHSPALAVHASSVSLLMEARAAKPHERDPAPSAVTCISESFCATCRARPEVSTPRVSFSFKSSLLLLTAHLHEPAAARQHRQCHLFEKVDVLAWRTNAPHTTLPTS